MALVYILISAPRDFGSGWKPEVIRFYHIEWRVFECENCWFSEIVCVSSATDKRVFRRYCFTQPISHFVVRFLEADKLGGFPFYGLKYSAFSVVKDINVVSSNSEILLNFITEILDSLEVLNQNSKKQNEIIERLNSIDEENSIIAKTFEQTMQANSEKIAKLNFLSTEMKNSTIDN